MKLRIAGMTGTGELVVRSLSSACGEIAGGVAVTFGRGSPAPGIWVIDSDDVLRLADAIRKKRDSASPDPLPESELSAIAARALLAPAPGGEGEG